MIVNPNESDRLLSAMVAALKSETEKIANEVLEEAKALFERRYRERIASVSASVANFYSIERLGAEILVRVKIDETRKP